MKAEELRIGNWVMGASRGNPQKVTPEMIQSMHNGEANYLPIPLTPEVLDKVEELNKCSYPIKENAYADSTSDFIIEYVAKEKACILYLFYRNTQISVRYVHEIQNWYYLYSKGKELTIKM